MCGWMSDILTMLDSMRHPCVPSPWLETNSVMSSRQIIERSRATAPHATTTRIPAPSRSSRRSARRSSARAARKRPIMGRYRKRSAMYCIIGTRFDTGSMKATNHVQPRLTARHRRRNRPARQPASIVAASSVPAHSTGSPHESPPRMNV